MPFNFKWFGILGSVLIVSIFPIRLSAQDISYATGTIMTNGPAIITAHPIGWNFPKAIDTAFVFQTQAGNKVAFSLPVALSNSAVRFGLPSASLFNLESHGPLWSAAGRYLVEARSGSIPTSQDQRTRMGHGVGFTEASSNASAVNFAAPLIAAVSLQYRFSVSSQSAQFGDTNGIVKSLVEKDNGVVELRMPTMSGGAGARFKELLSEAQYQALFPNRYGFGVTGEASDGHVDFYSYASFIQAIDKLSTIQVKILMKAGTDYAQKLIWTDTALGTTRIMITHPDYNADWNAGVKEDTVGTIRYADFCAEGTLEIRKRELAAFFANVGHETGGGWDGAPNGGIYAWGLYWREEVAWQTNPNNTTLGYVDASNTTYPPYPGKSYHGRGPIQISWNYNYGQVSEFLYGDKNVLLQAPELVLSGGDVAFMTAIWFWMYPQGTIPSSHDIMTGKWKPNATDIAAGRDKSRFGATINVVNGAQECGRGANDNVADRVGFFKWFSGKFGLTLEPVLDCYSQQPF